MKFANLIQKHSDTYKLLHKSEGNWDGPDYIEGEESEYEIEAAIFPVTDEEVEHYEGLGYTTKDIKIFVPVPVTAYNLETEEEEEIELQEDDEITYKGNQYVLDSVNDRTTHADFVKWIAVRKQDDNND